MSVIYLNVDKVLYNQISVLLPDIWPNIKINLLVADENLEKLGFCKSAPCLMTIDLSENEYEQLLDELLQLEIDAIILLTAGCPLIKIQIIFDIANMVGCGMFFIEQRLKLNRISMFCNLNRHSGRNIFLHNLPEG